jgi:hypothetical protein
MKTTKTQPNSGLTALAKHPGWRQPKALRSTVEEVKRKILSMSAEEREELIEALIARADEILDSGLKAQTYPGQNCLWAADLLGAAGRIATMKARPRSTVPKLCRIEALTQGEAEEIEALL